MAQAQAIALRAEERVTPICSPMIGPNSEIADLAEAGAAVPTAGSQAGSTITVSISANIDGQHSGSKRKSCDHGGPHLQQAQI
jgi:hypothetical protein